MAFTLGHRARGSIPGNADTGFDMLGDLPKAGGVASDKSGLPEMGGAFYADVAYTAGTPVYALGAAGRVSVGGFPRRAVGKAQEGVAGKAAQWIVIEDVAAGSIGKMVKAAAIKTSLNTSGAAVGDRVYLDTTAGALSLTDSGNAQVLGHVNSLTGHVAFDLWSGAGGASGSAGWPDGTAASPGAYWDADPDTGLFRGAANQIGFAIGGVSGLVLAGSAPTVSAGADTAGQDVYLFATAAGTGTSGAKAGGAFRLKSGGGGPAATTIASGAGGAIGLIAADGGAKTGTTGATGAGGALSGSAGTGGSNATVTAVAAGVGGAANFSSGQGGDQTGAGASGAGGAGGAAAYGSGAGGAASGAGSTGDGGAGGALSTTAGAGGASVGGTGGAGGSYIGRAGAGGDSSGATGGAGGTATLQGGAGGSGGNTAGGNVNLIPGAAGGSGLAGEVTVNSSTAGFLPVSFYWVPGSVDTPFFVASRAYRVKSIRTRVEVAGTDGGAVTAVINKAASGTAITAGTILHTGTIDLKGTAATNQTITLTATTADLEIAAGTCIGIDFTGTLTSATGCVTVTLAPV